MAIVPTAVTKTSVACHESCWPIAVPSGTPNTVPAARPPRTIESVWPRRSGPPSAAAAAEADGVYNAAPSPKAQLIVTENTRHFPVEALAPYHIETTNADDFLRDLLDIDPERMIEVLTTIANSRKMPPRTVEELLDAVEANGCKGFAVDMRAAIQKYYADN